MESVDIDYNFNYIYEPVFSTDCRYIDIWGGRGRGGSHFGTQYFLFLIMQPEYFRGYFMREVYGDIRNSLFRDFKDRIDETDGVDENDFEINDTTMTILYKPTGNTITSKGFKKSSGKATAKMKSIAGATHVLIEECEEVDELGFMQMDDSLRTTKAERIQILRLFNPPFKNHWIIRRNYNLSDSPVDGYYIASVKSDVNVLSIHSTYLDNITNMNQSTIENFESYKNNPDTIDYYYTNIKGYVSEGKRGRIYKTWKHIKDFPADLPATYYGLDFGFSNDPCSLNKIGNKNRDVYVKQLIYQTGLTNPQLSKRMEDLGVNRKDIIWADSAEAKSIQELKDLGWNVKPYIKTADSIRSGIKFVQSYQVWVTEDSTDIWNENEEYSWALDQNKQPTDRPEDKNNHAMDGIRYGVCGQLEKKQPAPAKWTFGG